MKYPTLEKLIDKLKSSQRVRGIFSTGTTATKLTPSSDIDFIVILDKNTEEIKSVFTLVENRFADIFFFDIAFIKQLDNKHEVSGNSFEGMFLEWLEKGKIEYDPENILSPLKSKIAESAPLQKVLDQEKRDFWIKTNYNFVANTRYYNSEDEIYHKALEFRLLYSVIELITAYFSLRDIPWRGEKSAIKYFEQNDKKFLTILDKYSGSANLNDRWKHYCELFNEVFTDKYQRWENDFIVAIANKQEVDTKNLESFWNNLTT